jgi:hypothetical protein
MVLNENNYHTENEKYLDPFLDYSENIWLGKLGRRSATNNLNLNLQLHFKNTLILSNNANDK